MVTEIQLTPLLAIYAVSALVTLALMGYGLLQLRTGGWDPTIGFFVGIVTGVSIWTVSRFFELLLVSETLSRFWLTMIYVGYGGATMTGLFFALAFTGRRRWIKPRYVAAVFLPVVLAVFVAATNPFHELFWTGEFVPREGWWGELLVHEREFQPLFHAYMVYTVGGALIGLYILLRMAYGSPNVYRRQMIAFTIGALAAISMGILFGLERQPFVPQFVDLAPVGFAVMGVCFGYAIFRHRMLDLVPVARNSVIESMRDGYIVIDRDRRIVDLNDAADELLDTDEGVVGSPIDEALSACIPVLESHEPGERTEEEVKLEIDGERRFLVASVSSLFEDDRILGQLLLLRDVTERRGVQKRYQALIENSSDLILVTEEGGEITYASPSATRVVGADPEVLVGMDALELVHEDDRDEFQEAVDHLLENPGERFRYEYRTINADGEQIYLEASVWNLLDNPFVEGIVVNAREITERKEREKELEEANERLEAANEQLEQFAHVISHDLRNPINVAKGHLDLARETDREESYEKVEQSLERMEAIIDDVLTLAREGESIGETEAVDLESVAREAWSYVPTDEATLEIAGNGTFEGDSDRLLQLFENLFRNAHEHVGEDVTVTVGLDDGTLYVEDDGPGIPEEKRDDIFETGYTTNEGGTGLGLSIVAQIASAHEWEIEIAEGRTGGARFEFHGVEVLQSQAQ